MAQRRRELLAEATLAILFLEIRPEGRGEGVGEEGPLARVGWRRKPCLEEADHSEGSSQADASASVSPKVVLYCTSAALSQSKNDNCRPAACDVVSA